MNYRLLTALLLMGTFGVASAQSQPQSQPLAPGLSAQPISLSTGTFRGPLSVLLAGVARAAGYEVVYDLDVDKLESASRPLAYTFVKQPFNQVWPLLMDLHGLESRELVVGTQRVLRISLRKPVAAPVVTPVADPVPAFAPPIVMNRVYEVKGDSQDVLSLLKDQFSAVQVTSMRGGRQLLLRGTEAQLTEALELLVQLDLPQATPPAPAPVLAREIYELKGSADQARTLLAFQYPSVQVAVTGANLLLSGPAADVSGALTVLARVDRAPQATPRTIEQRIFTLVNASAEDLKATIEGTLSRELTPTSSSSAATVSTAGAPTAAAPTVTAQPAASERRDADAATIIADARTNTLVVRGTAEQVAQVAELVTRLDQKVPQINVKVRIQELSETGKRSLGLDWKMAFGGLMVGSNSVTGLGASFDPTLTSLGFNILPSLNALENQGFTKRVYDGAVTLQSGQRKLNASTSSENASSAAAASIKSGGRMEINIPSSAGNIEKQIDYGVNIDFFNPQVAPDGTISLRLRTQVTGEPVVPESGALPTLLRFTNNEMQSTITVKDGQTVMLAGLTSQVDANSNAGAPFLSSLPVVGFLFGKQNKVKERADLMVVVTAEIVK